MHDVNQVVTGNDVDGVSRACDPSNEPDNEAKHEQCDQNPADDAAALVHLALLVIDGGASDAGLCVGISVEHA